MGKEQINIKEKIKKKMKEIFAREIKKLCSEFKSNYGNTDEFMNQDIRCSLHYVLCFCKTPLSHHTKFCIQMESGLTI